MRLLAATLCLTLGLGAISPLQPGYLTAYAAPRAENSAVTGMEMPAGATKFRHGERLFNTVLTSLSRETAISRKPIGKAEVFAWQGSQYRSDRVAFNRSAVKRALTTAGYVVKDISVNDIRDTNPFEHDDTDSDLMPFRPAVTNQILYFQATNESRGISILGVFLESEDAFAVGFLPVEFKGTPKAAPLPALTGANVVLVKDINDTMKGLPPAKLPTFEPIAKKPRTVRGLVKDSAGRPIAGAEIAVFSSAAGGARTTHIARTNAQGLYEVLLPSGVAEIAEGKCTVVYNGTKFELPLYLVSGEPVTFDPRPGRIEHFVLRTEREYGGTIRVFRMVEKGTIEVTITPVGRLMDGSAGRTFVYRFSGEGGIGETYLNGMPLGRYKLTARLLDDGDALPLQVRRTFGTEAERQVGESIQVEFKPGYSASQGNPGKSNHEVSHFEVTVQP